MQSKKVVKRLLSYCKPYKLLIVASFIFGAVFVGLTLIAPIIIGEAIDCAVGVDQVDFSKIFKLIGLLCLCVFGAGLFQRLLNVTTNKLSLCVVKDIRNDAFKAITYADLKFCDGNSKGEIISRVINDADIISDGLLQGVAQLFTGSLTIIATLAFMFTINYVIALGVVILTPISLCVATIITKKSYLQFRKQAELQGNLYSSLSETIDGYKEVKAFNKQRDLQSDFAVINNELNNVGWRAQFYSALTNPSTRFVNGLVFTFTGVMGALFCFTSPSGAFTVGKLSVFLSYANQYTKPFNEISAVITQLSNAASSAARVFEIIDVSPEKTEKGDSITSAKGCFELSDVCFSYVDDKPLIENFNLKVKSGQKVAIVGPTGCGKTTLINLLMRFYKIKSGKITLDGKNIYDYDLDEYRGVFGMVLQDTFMSEDTVYENIAIGADKYDKNKIIEAAENSYCDYFINNLPEGFDTVIGKNAELSQGEQQLISIARVMASEPYILILDEATSSIDTMTEARIQKAFHKIMKGKTSFIVAHRLSTIVDADVILVMKDGAIVEQGNHEELLAKKGFYYELYNSRLSENE